MLPSKSAASLKYPSFDSMGEAGGQKWSPLLTWYIQEKIDGSQFTFSSDPSTGSILFVCQGKDRSKEPMFYNAIDCIRLLQGALRPDLTYHGEYLSKPGHNVITYARRPRSYVVLYDIKSPEGWFTPDQLRAEAERLDLECVPLAHYHEGGSPGEANPFVVARELIVSGTLQPFLGGGEVEGVVVKVLPAGEAKAPARVHKIVSKLFKEKHKRGVPDKERKPSCVEEVVREVGGLWNVNGRFRKALIHLKESGREVLRPLEMVEEIEEELDRDLVKEGKEKVKVYLWGDLKKCVLSEAVKGIGYYYVTKFCPTEEVELYFADSKAKNRDGAKGEAGAPAEGPGDGAKGEVGAPAEGAGDGAAKEEGKAAEGAPSGTGQRRLKRGEFPDTPGKVALEEIGRKYKSEELFDAGIREMKMERYLFKYTSKVSDFLRDKVETENRDIIKELLWELFGGEVKKAARADLLRYLTYVQQTGQLVEPNEPKSF